MSSYSAPGSLDQFALRAGADIRSPLLWTLVDLYLQKPSHTGEETRHFTELMLRLLDQADAATRAAIAQRLESYPAVPEPITRRLAINLQGVAAPTASEGIFVETRSPGEPVTPDELSELFFAAHSAERRLILLNLSHGAKAAAAAFSGDAQEAAREFETAALARKPDAFMRAIERWLGITPALARKIVSDPSGEPIVVVAKAIGVAPDAVQRILLFINPIIGRSISRVYDLARLFEIIEAEAALALVRIWRATDPRPAAKAGPAPPAAGVVGQRMRRRVAGSPTAETRDPGSAPRHIGVAKT